MPGNPYVEGCIATSDGGVAVVTLFATPHSQADENGDLLGHLLWTTSASGQILIAETSDRGLIAWGATTGFDGICAFKLTKRHFARWQSSIPINLGNLTNTVCLRATMAQASLLAAAIARFILRYTLRQPWQILWTKEHLAKRNPATGFFSAITRLPETNMSPPHSTHNGARLTGILI
ncbi:MAG: hypothetical protein IPP17_14895 [Bacteroidetes bacterium]|nr:hypothetical protein [Bacteroidota bacterium]